MIRLERTGAVAHIVLDNPPVNVFDARIHKQFHDTLREFYGDPSLKVGIWRSAGDRAFCAGDDIKSPRPDLSQSEMINRHFGATADQSVETYPGWERETLRLVQTKPLIAAVHGACVGQGLLYMLMMTQLRIATPAAKFGFPEITHGMGGAAGASQMAQQIPYTAAMQMVLTGELMDAEFALRNNLVNEVVASKELLPRAVELAERIAGFPALALQVELQAYERTRHLNRDMALDVVEDMYRLQRLAFDAKPPLSE